MINEIDKQERIREQNRKAVKKYSEKTKVYAVKYTPVDMLDSKRLESYLNNNGISANSYIKQLIKQDLDDKNIPYINSDNE